MTLFTVAFVSALAGLFFAIGSWQTGTIMAATAIVCCVLFADAASAPEKCPTEARAGSGIVADVDAYVEHKHQWRTVWRHEYGGLAMEKCVRCGATRNVTSHGSR